MHVRKFHARAEFRRQDRSASWILAGVWIAHRFYPAQPGVDPVRRRLPSTGLVGWTELPAIIAATSEEAATIALGMARETWPKAAKETVPYP